MTLVLLVFIANCLKHLSPLLVSLLLISLVPPQNMITSFFKKLSVLKWEGVTIVSLSALSLDRLVTLQEISRLLQIFSDKPLHDYHLV